MRTSLQGGMERYYLLFPLSNRIFIFQETKRQIPENILRYLTAEVCELQMEILFAHYLKLDVIMRI